MFAALKPTQNIISDLVSFFTVFPHALKTPSKCFMDINVHFNYSIEVIKIKEIY